MAARDDVPNARYWVGRGRSARLLGRWAATVSWHKRWHGQKRAELARVQPVVSLAFNTVPVSSDHGLRTEGGDFSFDMCTFEHGPVQCEQAAGHLSYVRCGLLPIVSASTP